MTVGWERKRLADFAAAVSTGPFGSLLHKSDYALDGVPLVNPANIIGDRIVADPTKLVDHATQQRLSNYLLQDGDIVVGRRGEIGRCAVVGPNESGWICGTGTFFVRPLPSLDSRFLAYLIRSHRYREQLERAASGTTMMNLSNAALGDLFITVPKIHEQRRIVNILDEAFEGIATAKANAEKNLQNARALFESHLQSAFTDAWRTSRLGTLSDLATSITDGDHLPPPKSTSGVPFITIGNILKQTRKIDFTDTFMVPRAYFDGLKPNKKPMQGDILYTVTGSFGIPAMAPDDVEFCFQRHIGLIRPRPEINSTWLYYLLLSPQIFKQANDRATGTAQKTVSLQVLRSLEVPMVTPQQQQAMLAKLDELSMESQRLESTYQRKLASLESLKKSLLHQAFSGNL